ncbi:MAG: fibronectin type III domain-containing protein [Acidobacteriota bacterium]
MRRTIVALLFLLAACGRKSDPLPPIIEVPETTTDLAAYQEEQQVVLTWSYPQLTRAGRNLVDLARIEVWRLPVPPGQEQVGSGPAGEELRRQLILTRGALVARLEGATLERATRGSALAHGDQLEPIPAGTVPSSLWYAVRTRRRDGTPSALSNIVTWKPRVPPPAVEGVAGTPGAEGISLSWGARSAETYRVERRAAEGGSWETIATEVAAETFTDGGAPQGRSWRYRVRAETAGVRGAPSAEIEVAHPDVYPPPLVTGLLCLPETTAVRLRWDPSPESGIRYKVFRRQGEQPWDHLEEELDAVEYTDANPYAAETMYVVKAMDVAGNQSEAVRCTVRPGP